MLKGNGVSSLSFGSAWHFLETQLKYPVTNIDSGDLARVSLNKFNILILPEGRYSSVLNETTLKKLKTWVQSGGKIITLGRAAASFEGKDGFGLTKNEDSKKDKDSTKTKKPNLTPYDQRERERVKDFIT